MKRRHQFTAIIVRAGEGYVANCPELDVANQGNTVEKARDNLVEAIAWLLETAYPLEIETRLHCEMFITQVEVRVG